MEIPVNAQVECSDGVCGRSVYVLVNPVLEKITHLVVKDSVAPHTEYLVPVEAVSEAMAGTIQLSCSKDALRGMPPFVQTEFIQERMPNYLSGRGASYSLGSMYNWPYVSPEKTVRVPVEHLQIPAGELAVRRGTRVEATDGYVGRVDEFVINPESGHITHLLMREGHLWQQKEVIIPLSAMASAKGDTVTLNIGKQQVAALATFPVRRRWA
jgi:hypothetical protein